MNDPEPRRPGSRSLFVSYRRTQAAAVDRICQVLDEQGIDVWIDRSQIEPLDPFPTLIRDAIADSHAMLVWWSADYAESDICMQEFRLGWQHARQQSHQVGHRLWILNPEAGTGHIFAGELGEQNFLQPPVPDSASPWAGKLAARLSELARTGRMSQVADAPAPSWTIGVPRHPGFVGRGAELMRLHSAAFPAILSGAAFAPVIQVHGMAGIGKTALAAAYAETFAMAFPAGVWWFNMAAHRHTTFSSADEACDAWVGALQHALRADSSGLLAQLTQDDAQRTLPPAQVRQRLGRLLAERDEPFLWVLDNFPPITRRDLRDEIVEFLRAPAAKGRTLVTGRDRRVLPNATSIAVTELTTAQGQKLLAAYLPGAQRTKQRVALAALANEVGCHSLALVLLGEYAAGQATDCSKLVDQMRRIGALQRLEEIHEELRDELGDFAPGIVAAFDVSTATLEPEAEQLLAVASACSTYLPIPIDLLAAAFGHRCPNGNFRRALGALQRGSLLAQSDTATSRSTTIHPIVAAVALRRTVRDAAADRLALAAALLERFSTLDAHSAAFVELRDDIPHAERVLQALDGVDAARLCRALSRAHLANGNPSVALRMAQEAVSRAELCCGVEARETLLARLALASAQAGAGELKPAAALLQSLLETARGALPENDPDTLTIWSELASTLGQQHALKEAEQLCRSLLDTVRHLKGEHHADTLSPQSALAEVLYHQGQFAQARALQVGVHALAVESQGADSADAWIALGNLAVTELALGNVAESVRLQRQVLQEGRSIHGDGHPILRTHMTALADALAAQGEHAAALQLYEEALAASIEALGPQHPDSVSDMSRLVVARMALQPTHVDDGLLDRFMALVQGLLPAGHPRVLEAVDAIAEAHDHGRRAIGRMGPALAQVHAARVRDLGDDHLDSIRACSNLALALSQLGRRDDAVTLRRRALQSTITVLGHDHPDAATGMVMLSAALREAGHDTEADGLAAAAEDCLVRLMGRSSARQA